MTVSSEKSELDNKDKDFLFDVLKRYDHFIATTNVKAGLLLSFLGVVIFGVLLRLSLNNYANDCQTNILVGSAFLLLASCVFVIWKLIHVVLPNTSTGNQSCSLIFFSDVAGLKTSDEYLDKLSGATQVSLKNDLAEQVYFVAKVTDKKFKDLHEASNLIKCLVLPLLVIFIAAYLMRWMFS